MTALTAADFAEFFSAVHGYAPFPWQQRLAQQVLAGPWPTTIALPTASGKTAAMDVAVFAMAAEPDGVTPRRQARRVFLVVDRRVVVDEASERARRIAGKLADAKGGILKVSQEMLEYMPVGVIGVDDSGMIAIANRKAEEIFRCTGSLN